MPSWTFRTRRWRSLCKASRARKTASCCSRVPPRPTSPARHALPNGAHWTYDTNALSKVVGSALVQAGQKDWFFITADYAFGHTLDGNHKRGEGERRERARQRARPGQQRGLFLLLAAGAVFESRRCRLRRRALIRRTPSSKRPEFGLSRYGKKIATLLMAINEVHSVGLANAGGILLTSPFTGTSMMRRGPSPNASMRSARSCPRCIRRASTAPLRIISRR